MAPGSWYRYALRPHSHIYVVHVRGVTFSGIPHARSHRLDAVSHSKLYDTHRGRSFGPMHAACFHVLYLCITGGKQCFRRQEKYCGLCRLEMQIRWKSVIHRHVMHDYVTLPWFGNCNAIADGAFASKQA